MTSTPRSPERGEVAGGTAELDHEQARPQLGQPLAMAQQRRQPAGDLEPEGGRHRLLEAGPRRPSAWRDARPRAGPGPRSPLQPRARAAASASRSCSTSAVSTMSCEVAPQCTKLAAAPPTCRRSCATRAGTGTPAAAVPRVEVGEVGREPGERRLDRRPRPRLDDPEPALDPGQGALDRDHGPRPRRVAQDAPRPRRRPAAARRCRRVIAPPQAAGRRLQQGARLGHGRRPPAVLGAQLGHAPDQRGVRRRQRVLVPAHIVLEPGAAVAAQLQRPAVERELVPADAGAGPGRVGHQALAASRRRTRAPRGRPASRSSRPSRTGRAAAPLILPVRCHLDRLEDHRQVERLDLGLDAVRQHLGRQPVDQIGRVLVDAGREVARAGARARPCRA